MRTRTDLWIGCGGALLLAGCASGSAESPTAEGALARIDAATILQDVEHLSADALEGRGTGTPGEEQAAAFIEGRFQEIGLSPVAGSYRQELALVGSKRLPSSTLGIRNENGALALEDGGNVSFWSSSQKGFVEVVDAPLLFVGYGVEAPEYDWNDLKDAQLAGKVLLFLNDDPPVSADGVELFGGEARTYYGRWTYKFEQAMKHGAAGALMIHTTPSASYPFSVVQHNGSEEHFALDLPESGYQVDLLGWLDEATSETIAAALGTTVAGLFEQARRRDFEPIETGFRVDARIDTQVRRITSTNVFGLLEGSDPRLKSQVIVFSAHYDHLGTNPAADGDDKIFNGAWDNAAGTAAILELAEVFAAQQPRPRRSLLFLACAAEEKGSLGSKWFVAQPPFERSRLVGNINIDMPQIFGVTHDIAVIGADTNTMGETLRTVAAAAGVSVTGDPRPRAGSFYRSDQVNFAKAGIPALFVNPGSDYDPPLAFDPAAYRSAHYHQPGDEVTEEWDLSGLVRDLRLIFEVALELANAEDMPRWVPGNEFEEEWRALHGY